MSALRHFLLAEDDELDAELALRAFKRSNLVNEIHLVPDGIEAMSHLETCLERGEPLPAVVLLDIKMPRQDGLATLKVIKAHPRLSHLPVVMLTSSREHGDMLVSYKDGVNAYIVKPIEQNAFIDVIRALGLFWGVVNRLPDD
ncbi:response regulator [Chitinimonas lacunae]|uniref:Response regulator n=1 Tax=Chitinimonas lacunae TaxID=1963018 RepID=A0ABV8MNK3_9NEIS